MLKIGPYISGFYKPHKLPNYVTRGCSKHLEGGGSFSYLDHGQESVQQVNGQDKGLCAVAEEAGQTPQVLHFGISAFG